MQNIFLWLHIIAVATYVGGMVFLATIVTPFVNRLGAQERAQVLAGLGKRFRVVSWVAIAVIIVTGFGMLGLMGMTSQITSNTLLLWKLIIFAVMIILTIIYDMVLGSRSNTNGSANMRAFSSWISRATLLLGLVAMYLATRIFS